MSHSHDHAALHSLGVHALDIHDGCEHEHGHNNNEHDHGHSNGENHGRRTSLPNAGDLAAPGMLASALKARASPDGEIIFMLTDESHVRLALNLILNLEELRLSHHLVVASTAAACDALWARARQLKLSTGCGTSSFLQRGSSTAAHDAGLRAYGIGDSHVYHLWWQRWFFLSEAVGLGYNVLSLDTDVSLRANPYPLLHGALAHHSLLTGLDNDASVRPFYFPAANVGFVYAHGGAGSAAHWVLAECRRRAARWAARSWEGRWRLKLLDSRVPGLSGRLTGRCRLGLRRRRGLTALCRRRPVLAGACQRDSDRLDYAPDGAQSGEVSVGAAAPQQPSC